MMELRFLLVAALAAVAHGQGLPHGFSDGAKDLWGEIQSATAESPKALLSEDTCDMRLKLLKELGTATAKEAGQVKSMVLQDIGMCEFQHQKWAQAKRRFESAISELNVPSEDVLMQNLQFAPIVLNKEAAKHMDRNEPGQAAVAMRRARVIYGREKNNLYKNIAKGQKMPVEQVPTMLEEMKKKKPSEMGQNAEQIKGILGAEYRFIALGETMTKALEHVDSIVRGDDKESKTNFDHLRKSLSGPYMPGLPMDAFTDTDQLALAGKLVESHAALAKEIGKLDKHVTLLKRTKAGKGCETYPESCKIMNGLTDLQTNGFGETRVLALKPGKQQTLDICETNANLAVIMAIDGDISVTVGAQTQQVEKGKATVIDFCLPGSVVSKEGGVALFAQAWHPQVASLERTTEIRDKSKKWGIDEDAVKALTKSVNAAAKKEHVAAAKLWATAPASKAANERLETLMAEKRAQKEKEADEAAEAERNSDVDREKNLQELERKRAERKAAQEAQENKRIERNQKRQDEEAKKDPWLKDPVVLKEKATLDDLKEQRRDASAKLEFDVTKVLTKEISEQERLVAKTIKKA